MSFFFFFCSYLLGAQLQIVLLSPASPGRTHTPTAASITRHFKVQVGFFYYLIKKKKGIR